MINGLTAETGAVGSVEFARAQHRLPDAARVLCQGIAMISYPSRSEPDVQKPSETSDQLAGRSGSALEVLGAATRLGLTSFGGPVAHLGYFRAEYVERRRWVDEQTYADLVALCQFLPGPASSQVSIALGIIRAGLLGGLAAWIGFTLPSAILMVSFAFGAQWLGSSDAAWLHGLKIVAVAVVAQAVWGMARALAPDRERATMALLAAVALLVWPSAVAQLLVILAGALVGWRWLAAETSTPTSPLACPVSRGLAIGCWILLVLLLIGLPILRAVTSSPAVALADSFFRVGSLVFGGGHVVLPLLQAEVVPPGWVTNEQFVAGYGAAQAVPGPLFTFSAYLGATMASPPTGVAGACLALVAMFAPSFLMVIGALPFWDRLRGRADFTSALRGVNAAVVGLLLAALYSPVWTSAMQSSADVALGLAAFGLLTFWKLPSWLVVLLAAILGAVLHQLPV
jgi:chromate transporter